MRKQIKLWVMISDPAGETQVVPFIGTTIEKCMTNLHSYLDTYTGPGTRTEVIQSGYIYTGAKNGPRRHTTEEQSGVEAE